MKRRHSKGQVQGGGARLRLLVLAHDGAEDGALEVVEGGKMQAEEPVAKERMSAKGKMQTSGRAGDGAHSPTLKSATTAARARTNRGEGSVARKYLDEGGGGEVSGSGWCCGWGNAYANKHPNAA